jgi:uncharacterized SAM-binding protein YcdF (DUF218 family)
LPSGSLEVGARDVQLIWRWLAVESGPVTSDVLFAFGSRNLGVARTTARLHHAGIAPWIVVTGGPSGAGTTSEAAVYAHMLEAAGVTPDRIIVEPAARNTGENVALGMVAASARGVRVTSATLVAFPTSLRRCRATFARQFPDVVTSTVPGFAGLERYEASPAQVRRTVLSELDRLLTYPARGFFAPQDVPAEVLVAARRLRTRMPSPVTACAEP